MASKEQISLISSPEDFALASGVPLYFLYQWTAEDTKAQRHYRTVEIEKHRGGWRTLSIPAPMLKKAQRFLLSLLADNATISPAAAAYQKGKSLADHAQSHANAPLLVKADLVDFFGSISFTQIFWVIDRTLAASDRFGPSPNTASARDDSIYNGRLSWFLSKLCTLNDQLPQGAPTSPLLSNLVMKPIDQRLLGYCRKRNITYTRYADDLFFSGQRFASCCLLQFLEQLLTEYGFSLNAAKTIVLGSGAQHRITGVVANEKPQVSAGYRKAIRQEMYYIGRFGLRSHLERRGLLVPFATEYQREKGGEPAAESDAPILVQYLRQLLGRIQFVLQINPADGEFQQYKRECQLLLRQLPWAILN